MFTFDSSFSSEPWVTDCMEFSEKLEHLRIQLPLGIFNIPEVHKAMEENLELLLSTKTLTLLMPTGDDWVTVEEKVTAFCEYLCVSLPQLEALNVELLSPGWHYEAERASFPVRALAIFVDQIPHLKALSLEKLKFTGGTANEDIPNIIGGALKDHPCLEKFEWRGNRFDPASMVGIDPIVTSMATISTLQVLIVKIPDLENGHLDIGSDQLDDIAAGCQKLRVLKLEGIYVTDLSHKTALKDCKNLEQLELNLKLEEAALRQVPAMGKAFAKLLKPESSTLESLWIKLHFKQPTPPQFPFLPPPPPVPQVADGQVRKKRKLRATQKFHDEISSSLCDNTKLKVLGILFHDDTTTTNNNNLEGEGNGPNWPVLNAKSFHKCVANNRTLRNLCIPLCGHDEVIRFYLMVNKTEMYYRFAMEPSCRALLEDFLQVLVEQWCHQTSELHHLSLVYYYLRQMPILIPSSSSS